MNRGRGWRDIEVLGVVTGGEVYGSVTVDISVTSDAELAGVHRIPGKEEICTTSSVVASSRDLEDGDGVAGTVEDLCCCGVCA